MKSEILELHQAFIQAHLDKDVDFFVKDFPDDFISVSHGEILTPSRADFKNMISRYFAAAEFTEYKDLCEPIIGFSQDCSLAWIIMQVKVTGKLAEKDLDATWAGMMLYAKREGKWVRLAEVSNFK